MPSFKKKTSTVKSSNNRKTNYTKSSFKTKLSMPNQSQLIKMLPKDQRPRSRYYYMTDEEKLQYHKEHNQILHKFNQPAATVGREDGLSSAMTADESGPVVEL